jgi:hypothetical protein
MILFPAASLGTYLLLLWHRKHSSHSFWLASVFAFFIAVGRGPLPLFAALFVVPTVLLLIHSIRRREGLRDFALFALSDLLVLLALSAHYAATFEWTLPDTWGPGATLAATAGIVRLIATTRGPGPARFLFMWQGLFLIHWVSESASAALAIGALGILALAVLQRSDRVAPEAGLALALLLGSVGAPMGSLLIVGIAVTSFALGERFLSTWSLLAAPLSVASFVMAPRFHWSLGLVAATLVVLWVFFASRLALTPGGSGGRLPAVVASLATVWLLWSGNPELLAWLFYGAVVAATAVVMVSTPSLDSWRGIPDMRSLRDPQWLRALGWVSVLIAAALETRLILLGLSTGFL